MGYSYREIQIQLQLQLMVGEKKNTDRATSIGLCFRSVTLQDQFVKLTYAMIDPQTALLFVVGLVVLGVGEVVFNTIYRKKTSSIKPTLICVLDSLLDPFYYLRLFVWGRGNDIHNAVQHARESTGLTAIADELAKDPDHIQAVKRYDLARKLGLERSKMRYSPTGYAMVQHALSLRMMAKMQFIDYLRRHPKVTEIKLKDPVFVTGFPRTGTTFLLELLGLHEDVRSHYTWEQINPIPLTDSENIEDLEASRQAIYKKNKFSFELKQRFAGEAIQSIHRIGYEEPEECTVPCAFDLPWTLTEISFNMYAADELFALGAGKTFQTYRKFLQLMTWQAADRRDKDFTWMLKCPFYLPYLNELYEEFPNATFVWTHRHPTECIASACSLYETILRMGSEGDSVDKKLLGKAVLNYSKKALQKAQETIDKLGSKFKMIHVRYADNIKDSKRVCQSIFEKVKIMVSSLVFLFYHLILYELYCN